MKPETAMDKLLRETFRPQSHSLSGAFPANVDKAAAQKSLRTDLLGASRFVVDASMSAFMADLSTVPLESVAPVRRPDIFESLRRSARLPHPKTWIEVDARAFRVRLLALKGPGTDTSGMRFEEAKDLYGKTLVGADDVPTHYGWLLQQHPKVDSAVMLQEFIFAPNLPPMALPHRHVWNTDDTPLPWASDKYGAVLGHGLLGHYSEYMGVVYPDPIPEHRQVRIQGGEEDFIADSILVEFAGVTRYVLSFLATLNQAPITKTVVGPQGGFVARGKYRKYLEHTVVSLKLPARAKPHVLARRLVAEARRRAHPVRGHWRLYQRGPGALCLPGGHLWGPGEKHAPCLQCSAWRTWILEHQRGNDRAGFVTHEYAVSH